MKGSRHELAVEQAIARLLLCETAADGALPTAALRSKSDGASATSTCRRKLLCGTRSRATETVALPLSQEESQLD